MYYYIVNPAAGTIQTKSLLPRIQQRLTNLGIAGEWVKTTAAGDASRLASEAVLAGHTTIIAVGGDDTVNEVLNGLGDAPSVAIGVIPIGHANRIASQLGITGWQPACEVLAARRLVSYNLIAAGQKYFLSTLSIGFETDLDKAVDTTPSGVRAKATQLRASWGTARKYATRRARLTQGNGLKIECDLFSLTVGNQKFLNPQAEDKLIVSLTDRPSQRQLGAYLWHLIRHGTSPLEDTATTRLLTDKIIIETTPATSIMVDGKVAGRTPIAIRLTDRKVRFITEKPAVDRDSL